MRRPRVLPVLVANRLKDDPASIANSYNSASVLFADLVGFTPMSATMSPRELVRLLDGVFTTFDGFVAELGLEKIKTVGDAYLVAAGVPEVRTDQRRPLPNSRWAFVITSPPTNSNGAGSKSGSASIQARWWLE